MRSTRSIVCITGLVLALGVFDVAGASAQADAPTHPGPSVTCQTPVTGTGGVEISSARAERGTSLTPSAPDETCTVTG
jgi:hypothetical protein